MTTPLFGGRYRLLRTLGAGSQGLTFAVEDPLHPGDTAMMKIGLSGQEALDGTLAEFEALRRLHSPWIAPVLELGFAHAHDLALLNHPALTPTLDTTPRPYLIRAWIDGLPLLPWVQQHQPSTAQTLSLLAKITGALQDLHDSGLRHGDLKPDHILIVDTPHGPEPRLIDMGLSSTLQGHSQGGTPGYFAPERLRGAPSTQASDRFALGVTMLQALLNHDAPITAATDTQDLPEALHTLDLPARTLRALRALLDPDPQQRIALDELHDALLPVGQSIQTRLTPWAGLPFLGVDRHESIKTLTHKALAGHLPPVVLMVGPRGAGRSRMLRQQQWTLQKHGMPALDLPLADQPWRRLFHLGARLASLSATTYQPPMDQPGDRAHWIRTLAASLAQVAPTTDTALLWDDPGADLQGMDNAEVVALLLAQTPSLRLWATTTPDQADKIKHLFAELGVHSLTLPALTRQDLDGLHGTQAEHTAYSPGELDRAFAASQGLPSALVQYFWRRRHNTPAEPLDGHTGQILALAGLVPGGATAQELLAAMQAHGLPPDTTRTLLHACIAQGLLSPGPMRPGQPPTQAWTAPVPTLHAWPQAQQLELAKALTPLARNHPHLEVLAASLHKDATALQAAWHKHRDALQSTHADTLIASLLAPGLAHAEDEGLLQDYTDAVLAGVDRTQALELLQQASQQASPRWRPYLRLAHARLQAALGQKVTDLDVDSLYGFSKAQAEHILSQQCLRQGRYQEASTRAQTARTWLQELDSPEAHTLDCELCVTEAIAAAMRGEDHEASLAQARQDFALLEAPANVRARFHGLCGMTAYMRGALALATKEYRTALDIVEKAGLDAERPLTLLNLGTAHERQGRLSLARQRYIQGARACVPTTRASTRALLLANRANLDIKLGRPREARERLPVVLRIAAQAGLDYVTQFAHHLQADALAEEGDLKGAVQRYQQLASHYDDKHDKRHSCELRLKAGMSLLRLGQTPQAHHELTLAEQHVDEFDDLALRAGMLRAQLALFTPGHDRLEGAERFLQALDASHKASDNLTVLTEAQRLLERIQTQPGGADPLLLRELQTRVEAAWRRVALTLTPDLRADLADHLHLDQPDDTLTTGSTPPGVIAPSALSTPMSSRPRLTAHAPGQRSSFSSSWELAEQFYRMLSLGRRIIGEHRLDPLIQSALDIALDLSGAQRGFVLLRAHDQAPFEVAFSRDTDGRPITQQHLDISETIARQVAQNGQAILTVDASQDARFHNAMSVHKLNLTSVLCLPIQDRDRALGCLYLDRKEQDGAFTGHTQRMLSAFTDQVALAIVNARQVEQLQQEKQALTKAKQQIQELLQDKEALLMDLETRCQTLEQDLARERHAQGLRHDFSHLIAQSPAMRRVLAQLDRMIDSTLPIVIQGESGTGKEMIARALHFKSKRRRKPFIAVNCGALSETLLESELFGHRRGAFTGAHSDHKGLFEAAQGGTLFLDEVGEMSLAMQVKLLRALQERKIRPIGATHEVSVDLRVVAATHRDLQAMIAARTFREDLYYRLATLTLRLPPLRERHEDIPLLIRHLLDQACEETGQPRPKVSGQAVALLLGHPWPGNIRQLENLVRGALLMSDGDIEAELIVSLLPPSSPLSTPNTWTAPPQHAHPRKPRSRRRGRPIKCTQDHVADAMERFAGDREQAAAHLGISTRTLQRYISAFAKET